MEKHLAAWLTSILCIFIITGCKTPQKTKPKQSPKHVALKQRVKKTKRPIAKKLKVLKVKKTVLLVAQKHPQKPSSLPTSSPSKGTVDHESWGDPDRLVLEPFDKFKKKKPSKIEAEPTCTVKMHITGMT